VRGPTEKVWLMGRLARLFYRIVRLWWSVARPITVGVRVLLVRDKSVLLVRHVYHDAWYLVGGGVKRGESLEQAIRREAAEEVGAELQHLELFGAYSNFYEGKSDHIAVFKCMAFALTGQTDGEIDAVEFFALDSLPDRASPGTRRRIEEHIRGPGPHYGLW
jgi:ADP-ribose pyrophosphatase YjhB (NUDIX family)